MNATERLSLQLIKGTRPEAALALPKGRLFLTERGDDAVPFDDEQVLECAELIVGQEDISDTFLTQAQIIEYAGNYLGWGAGGGYEAQI